MIQYRFKNISYISFKDISLGIMIGSNKDILYGLLGRVWFIEINILFIHIKVGIIRAGHHRKGVDNE
jgi:hypothetical protein